MDDLGGVRVALRSVALVLTLLSGPACEMRSDRGPRPITIPDLTGMDADRAVGLVDGLDLVVRIERTDAGPFARRSSSPGVVLTRDFAPGVVVRQEPLPRTRVEPGAALTLFVPETYRRRPGERRFRLSTHCGLGLPLEFAGRFWLPVNRKLRQTINAPEGFSSHGYYDVGTIRRTDRDSIVYTSSTGVAVDYEPTSKTPGGCE